MSDQTRARNIDKAIDAVGLLSIPIVFLYALEHPLLEEPLRHISLLPGAVVRGMFAFLCCLSGIFLLETVGAGLLSFRNIKAYRGMPLAAGISWTVIGTMALLVLGQFGSVSAGLLLLPLVVALGQGRKAFDGSILREVGLGAWAIIAVFGIIAGAVSLAPSVTYDDHVYHLQAIHDFLESGSLWTSSDQPNIYRPMGHAAFMAWMRILFGSTIGGTANLLFLVAIALLSARRTPSGVLGTLVWLSMPQVFFFAGSSYSEPFLCLVFILVLQVFSREGDGNVIPPPESGPVQEEVADGKTAEDSCLFACFLGGLTAGLLPGIKYTGLLLIPVLLVSWHERFRFIPSFRRRFLPLLLGFVISCSLVAFPFYLRNGICTGNVTYPHLSSLSSHLLMIPGVSFVTTMLREKLQLVPVRFGLPFEDLSTETKDLAAYSYEEFTNCFGMGHDLLSILLAPWNVTQYGHFHNGKYPLRFFDGQLSPMFLISLLLFSALFFVYASRKRTENADPTGLKTEGCFQLDGETKKPDEPMQVPEIFACSLFLMTTWVSGSHQIRFLMPLVAYSAWAFPGLLERVGRKRMIGWILLAALSSAWTVGYGLNRADGAAPYLTGAISQEEYFTRHMPFYPGFAWANEHLPPSGKLLVLFEECTFLLTCQNVWTECIPASYINFLFRSGSAETVEAVFRKHGITHVFMPRYGWAIFADVDDPVFQTVHRNLFEKGLKAVYSDEGYEIYSWKKP